MSAIAGAALLVAAISTEPTTYYFSSEHGDDAATGLSPASPWRTLAKIQAAGNLSGATVLLEAGSVWVDESLVLDGLVDGRLGAFGNATLPRPAILTSRSAAPDPGAKVAAAKSRCITLYGASRAVIEGVHLAGCYRAIQLVYPARPAVGARDVVIRNCSFADIRSPYGAYQPTRTPWGTAIGVVAGFAGVALRNLTIVNNVAIRLDVFAQVPPAVNGLLFSGNTVARCGGNCVGLGASNMHLEDSVFLRDTPEFLFMYGTTDVIIGTVSGNNSIVNTDFNTRGEMQPGPDGCAVDFETSATGFLLKGNTFYRSWGAGIMVFGHQTTSHDFSFVENNFIHAGCVQALGDHASVALMCNPTSIDNPSGTISNNSFISCPGVPAIWANPQVPGCAANVTMAGNRLDGLTAVEQPQISYLPPNPASTDPFPAIPVVAHCTTPNATLRFTTDGSRPTETSPIFPMPGGLKLVWPGPNVAINVRGFLAGSLPSVTNGAVVERRRYTPMPSVVSSFDGLQYAAATGKITVAGWVVDTALPGKGLAPVTIKITVQQGSGAPTTYTVVANVSRPDVVKAGMAPNPDHGFAVVIPYDPPVGVAAAAGDELSHAPSRAWSSWPRPTITVDIYAVLLPGRGTAEISGSPKCLCETVSCSCVD